MIKILLVDDQPAFLEITRIFLEKEGTISVDTAESAEDALGMLGRNRYDAIVSDYEMTGMDGIAFLTEFKKLGIDKPFIIFTGRSREEIVIRALNTGADFYLQKTGEAAVQFAELRNMIQQAVMRKRVEEALIKSEINYRTIVESTDDSIYMVDKNLRYLFMNTHHQKRLGIPDGDYEGHNYREFHSPEDSERFAASIQQSIDTGKTTQDEYTHDGRWFIRRMSPVRNEALERYFAITVVSTEATGRKKMEEALRLSEENYRILVEATQDSIYTVDKEGRYLFMNSHHKGRLGIKDGDYQTRHYADFHTPEDTKQFAYSIREVAATRKFREDRYTRDGKTFLRKMYPVFDQSGGTVMAIAVISLDITGQ
jgi:PAS domain S-box-containing protein